MAATEVVCVIPSVSADKARLDRCLFGVRSSLPQNSKIVVVWNSPNPFPVDEEGIVVYRPGLNLGYGPAINLAAARNPSEFIWIVQDDFRITEPYVEPFAEALRLDKSLAALTPGIDKGRTSGRFNPRGGILLSDGSKAKRQLDEKTAVLGRVEFVTGGWIPLSGALIRTSSFLEIGGFDPALFPVGSFDVDLCWRLNSAGYSVGSVVNYGAVHHQSASTPTRLREYLHKTNGVYFREKVAGEANADRGTDVPLELLEAVAVAASSKLIGYARFVEDHDNRVRQIRFYRQRRFLGDRWDSMLRRLARNVDGHR